MNTSLAGDAYYMKGLSKYYQQEYEQAISLYRAAEKLYKAYDSLYYILPAVYKEIARSFVNDPDSAIHYFVLENEISQLLYKDQPVKLAAKHSELAGGYYNRGQFQKAEALFDSIQAIAAAHPDIYIPALYAVYNKKAYSTKTTGSITKHSKSMKRHYGFWSEVKRIEVTVMPWYRII